MSTSLETKTFEQNEVEKALLKLNEYAKEGKLFHGSKSPLITIDPRQAEDDDKTKIVTNLLGVYAASDFRIPILMALFSRKDPTKDWQSAYSQTNDGVIKVSGMNVAFSPGFVCVVSPDSFVKHTDEGDEDLVSPTSVRTIEAIEVQPEIVHLLEGIELDEKISWFE